MKKRRVAAPLGLSDYTAVTVHHSVRACYRPRIGLPVAFAGRKLGKYDWNLYLLLLSPE